MTPFVFTIDGVRRVGIRVADGRDVRARDRLADDEHLAVDHRVGRDDRADEHEPDRTRVDIGLLVGNVAARVLLP